MSLMIWNNLLWKNWNLIRALLVVTDNDIDTR